MSENLTSKDVEMQTQAAPGWTAQALANLLNGRWYGQPSDRWRADDIALRTSDIKQPGRRYLLVAIDAETWHQGSGNRGIYAGWRDTHETLKRHHAQFCGAIVQRFIPELPADFPQLVVENSYAVLNRLADDARRCMHGRVVAVTGTVGKSSTKELLKNLLGEEGSVIATRDNHNTRTGTAVTLARCVVDPDYAVLEVALSALWMKSGGVGSRVKADVAIITEIGLTQISSTANTLHDIARYKSRLCRGMKPGGYAILNRDMAEYDTVCQAAIAYGAQVVSYGFHPDATIPICDYHPDPNGSDITIAIAGQRIAYRLNVPSRGMASNSVAALAALAMLGLDVAQGAKRLATFHNASRKLQTEPLRLPTGGSATLIDDSYNAELLSVKNALEATALYPLKAQQRRVAILGRVVSLGELAQESHATLAEPILQAGFDKVYLHGEEMLTLKDKLPAHVLGGYFTDVDRLAASVLRDLRDGDVVLVKGSTRDSDFHLVINKMRQQAASSDAPLGSETATLLVNLSRGETRYADRSHCSFNPRHLSHLLLTAMLAAGVVAKKHRLNDVLKTKEIAARALQQGPALGLQNGQSASVKSLLQGMLLANARDAAINLADYLAGSSAKLLAELPALMAQAGMQKTVLNNVGGRTQQGQRTTLDDIAAMMTWFYRKFPHLMHWFSDVEADVGGTLYSKLHNIQADGRASYSYSSGGSPCWGFAIQRKDNELWLACVAGAKDAFHLDYLFAGLMAQEAEETATAQAVVLNHSGPAMVTMIGDTYFGEWYSAQRAARGVDDALQRHGYDHSFQGITPLLRGSDYTIANFEAALAFDNDGGLQGRKPYCLTGDPLRSAAALKKAGVNAVALGNNHVMDAGIAGIQCTLDTLQQNGIAHFGAGLNAQQAETPLIFSVAGRTFKVYSAYWYRRYMEQDCTFYAQPQRAGAACLSGGLIEQLRQDKASDQPITTIVMAHWGQDYRWTLPLQKRLARRLTDAGADLIIGSGPHMLGEIAQFAECWVAYSIGNGVFNSNGEYQRRGVPAFGFIARLLLGSEQPQLQLLPIYTDNPVTFWQPRPVTDGEFAQVIAALQQQGVTFADDGAQITTLDDGYHAIVLPLPAQFGALR